MYNKTFLYIGCFLSALAGLGIGYITDLTTPIVLFVASTIVAVMGLVTIWYRPDIGKYVLLLSAFMFFFALTSYMWSPTSFLWKTH